MVFFLPCLPPLFLPWLFTEGLLCLRCYTSARGVAVSKQIPTPVLQELTVECIVYPSFCKNLDQASLGSLGQDGAAQVDLEPYVNGSDSWPGRGPLEVCVPMALTSFLQGIG